MTELALMTVEITITHRDSQGFGLADPKNEKLAKLSAIKLSRSNTSSRNRSAASPRIATLCPATQRNVIQDIDVYPNKRASDACSFVR